MEDPDLPELLFRKRAFFSSSELSPLTGDKGVRYNPATSKSSRILADDGMKNTGVSLSVDKWSDQAARDSTFRGLVGFSYFCRLPR